jgi:hypothetical protein
MPQPVSYNPGTPVSGSIQENSISYVVDGQNRNYRGGFGGLSWMSEVPAANNVIFIGNSVSLGRGPANIPLFYPSYNNSAANIIYAANTLPGSPRNFTTTGSAYNWAATNNFFINNSDNPIPRINGDSLGLYIDANQPTSYPQTGTTWYDLSGKTNNSTFINGPSWNSNGWVVFDGVDDYVDCGNSITFAQGFTLFILFKTTTSTFKIMAGKYNGASYDFWVGVQSNGTLKFSISLGAGVKVEPTSTTVVNTGNWYLGTVIYNPSTLAVSLYVNGNIEQTLIGNNPFLEPNPPFELGNFPGTGYSYAFPGSIALSEVYTKVLSQSEIKQNYFQGNIVTGSLVFMVDANNLVSYPKSGTTWYNLTGSANGTLLNGPTFDIGNGGSIVFDGADDDVRTTLFTNARTNVTMTGWVYVNLGTVGTFLSNGDDSGGYCVGIGQYFSTTDNQIVGLFGNVRWILTGAYYQYTGWHHVVMTLDGSGTPSIYVNGVLIGTYPGSIANIPSPGTGFSIGSQWGIRYANMKCGNANFYSKALTPTEVQQNYQATKDKFLGQNIVTNGLVLNLDSANKDSYPGTGTTWNNTVSNSYNGTLNNGPSFLSNINGGVIAFDGVDDEVTGPKPTFSAVTLEYYCKLTGNSTGGYPHIVMSGNTFIGFIGNTSSARFRIAINPGAGYSEITSDLLNPSTNFNLYSMTYDGTTVRMYVNGVLQSNTMNIPPTFSLMDGNAYYLNATTTPSYDKAPNQIPIFRLYNRALSTTEVLQNYNAQKIRFGL